MTNTRPAPLSPAEIRLHSTGNGPPVVLLHCLGVDRRVWNTSIERLKNAFTLHTYDFPGHGETPVPAGPYGIEDLSRQLDGILGRAGIERAHVVGISLGGIVAQHFAATFPRRVDRLVLADTTYRYVEPMRAIWAQRAAGARRDGVSSLTEGVLKIWFTDDLIAQNGPAVGYVKECFAAMTGEGYALGCEALAAVDLEALVPKIQAPTLVVCGDQDIPSFLDAARWLKSNIPTSRLEWLTPAKHCSVMEQPDAFALLLRGFFY
jgi:3-oxoadipate enol-lactonase